MYTPFFFVYTLYQNGCKVRIGKGVVKKQTQSAVQAYLDRRYKHLVFDNFSIVWQVSEQAAYQAEIEAIDAYIRQTGHMPPANRRRGGAGGCVYGQCRGIRIDGCRCSNERVAGRKYCKLHPLGHLSPVIRCCQNVQSARGLSALPQKSIFSVYNT